jgi:cytochrome b561
MLRLARVRRHLHWWTAALITIGFAIAWVMTALPVTALLVKFLLYQVHKSLGLCVAGLAAVRLLLAWRANDPPRGIKAALYGLALTVPLLGYFAAASSPTAVPTLFFLLVQVPHAIAPKEAVFDVVRPIHEWLAVGLVILAAWHGYGMRRRATGRRARPMAGSPDAHSSAKP